MFKNMFTSNFGNTWTAANLGILEINKIKSIRENPSRKSRPEGMFSSSNSILSCAP